MSHKHLIMFDNSFRYYYDKNILTKISGKRYAYKFDFVALKLACEAQQNPMPSDTKEGDLHAIYSQVTGSADQSTPCSVDQSPASTSTDLRSPEYHVDGDYTHSPMTESLMSPLYQEYSELECSTTDMSTSFSLLDHPRRTPPPPYRSPERQVDNIQPESYINYGPDLNNYGEIISFTEQNSSNEIIEFDTSIDYFSEAHHEDAGGIVSGLIDHSCADQGPGYQAPVTRYQDLAPQHWSHQRHSLQVSEFDLSFLSTGDQMTQVSAGTRSQSLPEVVYPHPDHHQYYNQRPPSQ